jgi:hypothetical protein
VQQLQSKVRWLTIHFDDMFIFFSSGLDKIHIFFKGIWTSTPALPIEETWVHHVVVQHPGVVAFLFMDLILLLASTILTTSQASQGD